jgi:hypothetical protein
MEGGTSAVEEGASEATRSRFRLLKLPALLPPSIKPGSGTRIMRFSSASSSSISPPSLPSSFVPSGDGVDPAGGDGSAAK